MTKFYLTDSAYIFSEYILEVGHRVKCSAKIGTSLRSIQRANKGLQTTHPIYTRPCVFFSRSVQPHCTPRQRPSDTMYYLGYCFYNAPRSKSRNLFGFPTLGPSFQFRGWCLKVGLRSAHDSDKTHKIFQ